MRTRLIACGLLIAGAVAVSGQSQRQPATLDDLLTEIRALRADLKVSAAATTRTQMLTARLQLQEQRIAVLANQRSDVMARLAVEARLRADAEAQVQRFDEMKNRNESVGIPHAELEDRSGFSRAALRSIVTPSSSSAGRSRISRHRLPPSRTDGRISTTGSTSWSVR